MAFLDAELKRENDRRASVVTRAGSSVTGTTGLVTLVLALFAVIIGKDTPVTGCAKVGLTLAVLALLVSAVCALRAYMPRKTSDLIAIHTLRGLVDNQWMDTEPRARAQSARIIVDQIEGLRAGSYTRGRWLSWAGILQVAAVAALGFSTLAVILPK